jgi:hypothetical protein
MTAQEIDKELQLLKADATQYRTAWDNIASFCLPSHQQFTTTKTKGDPNTNAIFDSTAYTALVRWIGIMNSVNTPQNSQWHKMGVIDEELSEDHEVQIYLDALTRCLFKARYNPQAGFVPAMNDRYMTIGAFGNSVTLIDDIVGKHLLYKPIPLYQCYFAENYNGQIDTVYRDFTLQARQLEQKFGRDNLPEAVKKSLDTNPYTEHAVIHCVKPNEDQKVNKKNFEGMAYSSYYVCERQIISRGGYRSFPYSIGQYIKTPGEIYAYGPAMMAYPEVSMVNRLREITLQSAELQIAPPILLPDDDILDSFNLSPLALNPGGLDPAGNPRAKAFDLGANLNISDKELDQGRRIISACFMNDLFDILVQSPEMSATQAMIRAQEKGALLAPALTLQQSMSTSIQREIDILTQARILPQPPRQLLDRGGVLQVQYTSNLDRLQLSEEGVAIMRLYEQQGAIAQYDQSVIGLLDNEANMRRLREINGAPAISIISPERRAEQKKQMQQAEQMNQIMQAAPVAVNAAKTVQEINQMQQGQQ